MDANQLQQILAAIGNLGVGGGDGGGRRNGAMKVVVDYDLCEANALCMDCCPEVFRVEEDDTLTILMESPPEDLRAKLEDAVRLCPRQAISLEG